MISNRQSGTNYSSLSIGSFDTISNYIYDPERIPGTFPGKLFLKDELNLSGMEISFNSLAPGKGMPFIHAHTTHEELFVCLKGKGELSVDDERFEVHEGSCVRLAPQAERSWRNIGEEKFIFLVVQAKEGTVSTSEGGDGFFVNKPVNWE